MILNCQIYGLNAWNIIIYMHLVLAYMWAVMRIFLYVVLACLASHVSVCILACVHVVLYMIIVVFGICMHGCARIVSKACTTSHDSVCVLCLSSAVVIMSFMIGTAWLNDSCLKWSEVLVGRWCRHSGLLSSFFLSLQYSYTPCSCLIELITLSLPFCVCIRSLALRNM
jgi:hypothetical protein